MRRLLSIVLAITVMITADSCTNSRSPLSPPSSGKPFEVLVVCNNTLWNSAAGIMIKRMLEQDVPGLPQAEKMFDLSHTDRQHFNQITHLARNIVIIDCDNRHRDKLALKLAHDVYASPQTILLITARDEESLLEELPRYRDYIPALINREELKLMTAEMKNSHNRKAENALQKLFGIKMNIPADISSAKYGKNFAWLSNNSPRVMQNVCIYAYDSDSTPNRENFIRHRDSIMRANIPGETPAMYMKTVAPTVIWEQQGDNFAARGLWEMENDAMGGPFISIVHTGGKDRIIVTEGFVYAPGLKKRYPARRLEAVIYTYKNSTEKRK